MLAKSWKLKAFLLRWCTDHDRCLTHWDRNKMTTSNVRHRYLRTPNVQYPAAFTLLIGVITQPFFISIKAWEQIGIDQTEWNVMCAFIRSLHYSLLGETTDANLDCFYVSSCTSVELPPGPIYLNFVHKRTTTIVWSTHICHAHSRLWMDELFVLEKHESTIGVQKQNTNNLCHEVELPCEYKTLIYYGYNKVLFVLVFLWNSYKSYYGMLIV